MFNYRQKYTDFSRNEEIIDACNALIKELQEAPGAYHPTKQERILQLLKSKPNHDATLVELAEIFVEGANPERLAQQKISELNAKLEAFGLHIERIPLYRITHKQ